MLTKNCKRYGLARDDHFWIVNSSEKECFEELREYARKRPGVTILYSNCGTKPGKPIPVPETVFEVYTPQNSTGIPFGWKIYQHGR